jgi:hypothetical protein
MPFRVTSRRLRERRCYPALRASRGRPANGIGLISQFGSLRLLSRGVGLPIASMLLGPGDFYGQGCGGRLNSPQDFARPQFFGEQGEETVVEIADRAE